MTRRLAILAQFDPEGGVPEHVRVHLEGLRPVVERLILVSNSPIDRKSRSEVEQICDRVVERENTGWDFAGWRDVVATEDVTPFDWVILTNSSVIGPLFPLEPILSGMEAKDQDIWGMVLSKLKGEHLQSYFLAFSQKVTASPAWSAWWDQVEDIDDKDEVIRRYETRMTRHFGEAGFTYDALIENPKFPQSIKMVSVYRFRKYYPYKSPYNVNYTHRSVGFYEELLAEGWPYLKASLAGGKDTERA
jgi:rhamnosyltransferase